MKKMSKTLGAVAASAALAIGCAMPAFAAEGSVNAETQNIVGDATGATGETEVRLFGYDSSSQIVATIPVSLTVAAPQDGGAITPPTADKYAITNQGDLGIKVTKVKGVPYSGWTLSSSSTVTPGSNHAILLNVANGGSTVQVKPTEASITADFTAPAKGDKVNMALSGEAQPKTGSTFAETAVPAVKVVYTIAQAD